MTTPFQFFYVIINVVGTLRASSLGNSLSIRCSGPVKNPVRRWPFHELALVMPAPTFLHFSALHFSSA